MTGAVLDTMDDSVDQVEHAINEDDNETSSLVPLPPWVQELRAAWGEELIVAEWEHHDTDPHRHKNGWEGHDLVHDQDAPVRVIHYYVQYGSGLCGLPRGGVGTTLTGITHFTKRAESHAGYCHGGSMCSVLDDVIGWVAFLVTGSCQPWTGFTVQVNTSLKRPISVDSMLLVQAKITKVERRKVSVSATIFDPSGEDIVVHAEGEGLVILNRGVLPEEESS